MGLDMYLTKSFYVKNWDHMKPEHLHKITVKKGGKIRADIDPKKICEITVDVMYWRKANHIHKWFVDNCQDGVDDCRDAYVSLKQLEELHDTCATVLKASKLVPGKVLISTSYKKAENGDLVPVHEYADGLIVEDTQTAEDLLPVGEGFFFGSYEYNEWYLNDIKRTLEMLDVELLNAEESGGDYHYRSSW